MSEKRNSNYWLDLDRYNIKQDKELNNIKEELVLGRTVSEKDDEVELSLNLSRRSSKTFLFKKEDLISAKHNPDIAVNNLSQLGKFTVYDAVLNTTNNFSKNNYFNFLTDYIIFSFSKFPITNTQEHFFENYLLTQEFQKHLNTNFNTSLKEFDHLKENIKRVINSGEEYSCQYDEYNYKLIQKLFTKNENTELIFLCNMFNSNAGVDQYEEIKYLIQTFSLYNKYEIFKNKDYNSTFDQFCGLESEYKFYDKIYYGLKMLEMFGCASIKSKFNSDNVILPRFSYKIKMGIDKETNCGKWAKIEVLNFNRDVFDSFGEERLFNIFHILQTNTNNDHKSWDYKNNKMFSKHKFNLVNEDEENKENYKLLFEVLFTIFNFSKNDVKTILQTINLILILSNFEFDVDPDKNNEYIIKNIENHFINVKNLFNSDQNFNDENFKKLISDFSNIFISQEIFIINSTTQKSTDHKINLQFLEQNVKNIIKDLYESLFYFIVDKINLLLTNKFNSAINCKEIHLTNVILVENTNQPDEEMDSLFYSNTFNLLNLYQFLITIRQFENEKINIPFEHLSKTLKNLQKIESDYDRIDLLNLLENFLNYHLLSSNDNKLNFISTITNEKTFPSIYNLDISNKFNAHISKLQKNNNLEVNTSLINLVDFINNKIIKTKEENFFKFLFSKKESHNNFSKFVVKRNIVKEYLDKFNSTAHDNIDYRMYIINLSDSFDSEPDMVKTRNNILKSLKILKIKSYIDNILNHYPYYFTRKAFINKYLIPVKNNTNYNPLGKNITSVEEIISIININPDSFLISEKLILLNYNSWKILENIFELHLKSLKNNKKIYKLIAILKSFSCRQKVKIQLAKKEKIKLNTNGFNCSQYITDLLDRVQVDVRINYSNFDHVKYVGNFLDSMFENNKKEMELLKDNIECMQPVEKKPKKDINKIEFTNKTPTKKIIEKDVNTNFPLQELNSSKSKNSKSGEKKEIVKEIPNTDLKPQQKIVTKEINFTNNSQKLTPSKENETKKQNKNKKTSPKKTNIDSAQSDNIPKNSNKIINPTPQEQIINDKVTLIQNSWRSARDKKILQIMNDKVFIIQRCFRNYLIKKYDLPSNYFFNEKFLKIQQEKFEKNYIENIKILFPAIFDENFAKILNEENLNGTRINTFLKKITQNRGDMFKNNLSHNANEEGKIHLFTKVLDMDLMVETDEVYENLWAGSFDRIYSHCLKTNSPVQMVSVGSAHTVCVNNKGRLFSFGWNNYGQCGIPINSSVIAKDEINNDYLIELTEFNELKPRVLNKVDGIKLPQIEEVIMTKNIACGEDHTLVLDHEGRVWAFGLNLNGQLGLGHNNTVEKPTKITSLAKYVITSVKSEGDINFAVSNSGDTFMWPWNDRNGNIMLNPLKLQMEDKITNISCGNNFVLMLNHNGMVLSMGKANNYGQLGHGDVLQRHRPTLIDFFVTNNERITQISCGYKHSVARSSNGHAFTWGLGVKGQLGHGDFNNYSVPYQVKVESPLTKIYQVSAGFRNTFFLIENRKVYFSGCNGSISMQNIPIQFNAWEKIPELSNEANYSIVRIMNTWNKSFSIFYATIADTTTMKDINVSKLNQILINLTTKWDSDSVDAPYIDSIAKYFSSAYMKKLNQIYCGKNTLK